MMISCSFLPDCLVVSHGRNNVTYAYGNEYRALLEENQGVQNISWFLNGMVDC
jgi:hypothetical protein